MANIVIVGAQWGDEAKGKIIDYLASGASMVVRYGGGNNAGHSVKVGDQEYSFHLVPSGILHPHLKCVVSSGTVIDPLVLASELDELSARGISLQNLALSPSAHLILPYHRLQDQEEETLRGEERIGTTGRGIGPAYADKASRTGIRLGELTNLPRFRELLFNALVHKNLLLTKVYGLDPLDPETVYKEYAASAHKLIPYIKETTSMIAEAAQAGGTLFEGAQGSLLDIDLGTYPYVTSSHPIAGGACIGTGVGPTLIDKVIGVSKSYTTRVGAGIFPTELLNDTGNYIREKGREYGTTTGRPRRCGWLDMPVLRYSSMINGLSGLALGHLDVLSGLKEVNICTAYRYEDGTCIETLSENWTSAGVPSPIYETLPGWEEDLSDIRTLEQLPVNARRYVEKIEKMLKLPIVTLSFGPDRDQTLVLDHTLHTQRRSI